MIAQIDILINFLTFLVAAIVGYLAVRRFGLHRESATFLRVLVTAKELVRTNKLVLTSITVKLDNLGQTRIDARTKPRNSSGFLYDDGWDRLQHAGTLKIRRVLHEKKPFLFDWYSLPTISMVTKLSSDAESDREIACRIRELEQINYLDDYQDPEADFAEVHFWLEPKESYELLVSLWLPPGIYAAKAVFLGKEHSHKNEEYWSHMCTFTVGQSDT